MCMTAGAQYGLGTGGRGLVRCETACIFDNSSCPPLPAPVAGATRRRCCQVGWVMCMHTYADISMHICAYVRVHMHQQVRCCGVGWVCIQTCTHVYIHVFVCIHMQLPGLMECICSDILHTRKTCMKQHTREYC